MYRKFHLPLSVPRFALPGNSLAEMLESFKEFDFSIEMVPTPHNFVFYFSSFFFQNAIFSFFFYCRLCTPGRTPLFSYHTRYSFGCE